MGKRNPFKKKYKKLVPKTRTNKFNKKRGITPKTRTNKFNKKRRKNSEADYSTGLTGTSKGYKKRKLSSSNTGFASPDGSVGSPNSMQKRVSAYLKRTKRKGRRAPQGLKAGQNLNKSNFQKTPSREDLDAYSEKYNMPPKKGKKGKKYKKSMALGGGGRFAALKAKLGRKGAKSPGALAAWIGRRKYGAKRFASLGRGGR
jgi:hypothetical protein